MKREKSLKKYLLSLGEVMPHVFLIYGDRTRSVQDISDFLSQDKQIELHQNPDIFWYEMPQFSIKQVRAITDVVSRKNTTLDSKIITISTNAFGVEAQNALLKTIEDPQSETIFFLCVPEGTHILDTVVSRSHVVVMGDQGGDLYGVENFLKMTFIERINFFKEFQYEDEQKKIIYKKDKFSGFISELEKSLVRQVYEKKVEPQVIKDISDVAQYVFDRSANIRQIIEYIALRIPLVK